MNNVLYSRFSIQNQMWVDCDLCRHEMRYKIKTFSNRYSKIISSIISCAIES